MPTVMTDKDSTPEQAAVGAIGSRMLWRTAAAVGAVAGGFFLFATGAHAAGVCLFVLAAGLVARSVRLAIRADSLRKGP